MKLSLLVGVAFLATASAFAYDAPSESVQDSIRAYSDTDRIGFGLIISPNCGLDWEATESSVEGEFIRSRVDKLPIPVDDWDLFLLAKANCIARPSGGYVYNVGVEFAAFEEGVVWTVDLGHGAFGITPDEQDISDAILQGTRDALTDFIYSHGP